MEDLTSLNAPSMPENSVAYRAFVIPTSARPRRTLAELDGFRNACLNALGHRLASYIWQEQPFKLSAVEKSESAGTSLNTSKSFLFGILLIVDLRFLLCYYHFFPCHQTFLIWKDVRILETTLKTSGSSSTSFSTYPKSSQIWRFR